MANVQLRDKANLTELLTARDLAKYLRLSIRMVWKLNTEGLVPKPVRIGRSVRWRTWEVAEWIWAGCPSREAWEKRAESVRIGGDDSNGVSSGLRSREARQEAKTATIEG